MFLWLKDKTSQNEDSSIPPLLLTALPPSAVQHIPHLIDYSLHAEAVQLLLYSQNESRNKTSKASVRDLCARQPAQFTSANLPLLVVILHSIQTSCRAPQTTNSSKAEPFGSEGTCAFTVLPTGNQILSTLSIVTLTFKNLLIYIETKQLRIKFTSHSSAFSHTNS